MTKEEAEKIIKELEKFEEQLKDLGSDEVQKSITDSFMNIYQSVLLAKNFPSDEVEEPPPAPSIYTYVVDQNAGSDSNDGSPDNPFATIAKAASVWQAGNIIGVMNGTYREGNIVPVNGGTAGNDVILQAVTGQTPVISGFNLVGDTGWAVYSGQIYRKAITLPINGYDTTTAQNIYKQTVVANQIMKSGVMQVEARWPKISVGTDAMLSRANYRQLSDPTFGVNSLTDATLPIAAPGLVGATLISNGWFANESKTILTHSGNTITYGNIWDNSTTGKWFRRRYYLTNKLALLTQATEWHYQVESGQGYLYYWQSGGGSPTGLEYKARNWAFDLRNKPYIKIRGITFTGCEPYVGNESSLGIILDNIDATYMNHHVRHDVWEWQGVGMAKQFGTKMLGSGSQIINSRFSHCASQCIWSGENTRVENNLIHHIGYAGYWGNGVSLWGTAGNQVITRNTIHTCGRSPTDGGYNFGNAPGTSRHNNVEISYNDLHTYGMLSHDVGVFYTWGQCDYGPIPLNFHHNWGHDCQAPDGPDVGINVGFYLDQATGPFKLHHNVFWNNSASSMYHETVNETRDGFNTAWTRPNPAGDVYNNTFAHSGGVFPRSYVTYRNQRLDRQRGNIYVSQIVTNGSNGDIANSVMPGTNPQFVASGLSNPQLHFQLQAGSPARNIVPTSFAGLTGTITDTNVDAGAYKYNDINDQWVPGYVAVPYESSPLDEFFVDNTSVANVFVGSWLHFANLAWTQNHVNKTISVATAAESHVTTAFTGNRVELYMEKRENHAIVAISVDGGAETNVDLYAATTANGSEVVYSEDLVQGNHTIKVRLTNTKNGASTGSPWPFSCAFDAIKVFTE